MNTTISSTGYNNSTEQLKTQDAIRRQDKTAGQETAPSPPDGYRDQVEIHSRAAAPQSTGSIEVRPTPEPSGQSEALELLRTVSRGILENSGAAVTSQANSNNLTAADLLKE